MDTTNGKLKLALDNLDKLSIEMSEAAAAQEEAATQYENACYEMYRSRSEYNVQLERVRKLEREAGLIK